MHGEADFDNPKFGHLIFTNVGVDALEESLLYHYEIANLDLNAQLAVLSACETGVGKYEAGEGVFSLARSFMYAGVPSIVMSLWKVNDQSTSQIMPLFYQNLSKGMEKSRAFTRRQIRILGNSRTGLPASFLLGKFCGLRRSTTATFTHFFGLSFWHHQPHLDGWHRSLYMVRRGYKFNISNKKIRTCSETSLLYLFI
jgi:hypothetical protein